MKMLISRGLKIDPCSIPVTMYQKEYLNLFYSDHTLLILL